MPPVKAVALGAGLVLLIAAVLLFAIAVFPGTNADRDTWLGALIFLVMAVAVAVLADVLIIVGLRQPAATTRIRARAKRSSGRIPWPALILAAPLVLPFIVVGTVATWLARTLIRTGEREVGDAPTLTSSPHGDRAQSEWGGEPAEPVPARERPAIAAMLAHGVSLRWEAAVIATLLDLAARGYINIAGESGGLWCRRPSAWPAEPLVVFERLLMDHVDGLLAAGDAPIQALLPDYEDEEGNQWFRRFERAVLDQAHRQGLVSSPRTRGGGWGYITAASGTDQTAVSHWWAIREGLLAADQLSLLSGSRVAVDDPMLPWAIATGAAEETLQALLPSGPWSSFGNHWHSVSVPRRSKGGIPWWSLPGGRADQRRTFAARVIRRWTRTDSSEYGTYTHYFLAVDDGGGADALVYRVKQDQYRSIRHYSDVLLTVDLKGRLADLAPFAHASGDHGT